MVLPEQENHLAFFATKTTFVLKLRLKLLSWVTNRQRLAIPRIQDFAFNASKIKMIPKTMA